MLGLNASSKTTQNLLRTAQCVLNLPSSDIAANVKALARTTWKEFPNQRKLDAGYQYVKDKFGVANLISQSIGLCADTENTRVSRPNGGRDDRRWGDGE